MAGGNIVKRLASLFCFVAAICGVISCNVGSYSPDIATGDGPVTLGFGIAGGSSTKTSVNDDGKSVSWSDGDKVRLWAVNSAGVTVIDAHPFTMLGSFGNEAIFTAQFANPMPEDTYTYYACYPAPLSSDGDILKFSLPANQDGRASGVADIMISGPVEHSAMKPLGKDSSSDFKMALKHMVHILKFYLPEGSNGLNGEGIRKIKLEMDGNVVGTMSVDRSDPSKSATLTDGGSTVILELDEPLTPSYGDTRNYAFASICPTSFDDGARMKVTLYSDSWIGNAAPFNIAGRDFKAGHTTPVRLNVLNVDPYYTLNFKLSGNNLGEDIQEITFTVDDSSLHLGDEGGSSYTFNPGRDIAVGETVTFSYTDINTYLALGGHKVAMTYESEHVRSTESFTLPDLETFRSYTHGMTVPYLLFEDFSGVSTFSSNDEHTTSSTGSKDAVSFLNGWSGGRVGGQAGKCVRIAGRRECGMFIDAHYPARMDSAPLPQIKSPVNIEVSFDYGTDRAYQMSSAVKGQTVYVGYVTSTTMYKSGDETGTFEGDGNNISTDVLDGSWTSTPNRATMVLHNIPAGTQNRISWRDDPWGKSEFGGNTTTWCYIDNVKVVVAPK